MEHTFRFTTNAPTANKPVSVDTKLAVEPVVMSHLPKTHKFIISQTSESTRKIHNLLRASLKFHGTI